MKVTARSLIPLCVVVLISVFTSTLYADEREAVLQWQRMVPLGTPVSGVVIKVNVRPGNRVEKGEVLLQLDDRVRMARVTALEAELKRAKNNRDESARELERTQDLYDRTLISQHELELVRIQKDAGEAQFQTAKARLVQAQIDLEYSSVRAPFAGWVVDRNVEVGQTVVSELQAEPLVTMVEANLMFARAQVAGSDLGTLKVGDKANVELKGVSYRGNIYHIGLNPIVGKEDHYNVDVAFDTGGKLFRAGQAAKVSF